MLKIVSHRSSRTHDTLQHALYIIATCSTDRHITFQAKAHTYQVLSSYQISSECLQGHHTVHISELQHDLARQQVGDHLSATLMDRVEPHIDCIT